jgi:hypothetical protein
MIRFASSILRVAWDSSGTMMLNPAGPLDPNNVKSIDSHYIEPEQKIKFFS